MADHRLYRHCQSAAQGIGGLYGQCRRSGGDDPTVDKDELIARILDTIEKAKNFLRERGFELADLIAAVDFMKLSLLQTAANAVCGTIEDKKVILDVCFGTDPPDEIHESR